MRGAPAAAAHGRDSPVSHDEPDNDCSNLFNPVDFRESGNKSMRYSFESERGGIMMIKKQLSAADENSILSAQGNLLGEDGELNS